MAKFNATIDPNLYYKEGANNCDTQEKEKTRCWRIELCFLTGALTLSRKEV